MKSCISAMVIVVLALGGLACDSERANSPGGSVDAAAIASAAMTPKDLPEFPDNPDDFILGFTNPYLAFETGRIFTYEGETEDGVETVIVTVTAETKTILGVVTTVVHDQAFLDGELIENTFDWFAEDEEGNVWYFGEYSEEIENGVVVSTEGSWEAGVDGAEPGILMLAEPAVGTAYSQEFAEDVAEDMARVLSLCKPVEVPFGSFDCALKTMEWTPLEPGSREFKYCVEGVGLVLEVAPSGGQERLELVAISN